MSTGRRITGLDLGNYNSKVCIFNNGEPVAMSLKQGSFSIPTLIINCDGEKQYGYQASMISHTNKDHVAFEFLYYLHIKKMLSYMQRDAHSIIPSWSPLKTGERVFFKLGHNDYLDLNDAIKGYVEYLLDCASEYLSYGKTDILAVSVPIYHNFEIKNQLPQLFDGLSLSYSLFWEPEVGVLAHIYNQKKRQTKDYVLFCSYGSLSFDVALVSTKQNIRIVKEDGRYSVECKLFGGKYNTTLIRRHLENMYKDYKLKDVSKLQSIAEQIKLAFYTEDEYYFDLQEIADDAPSCMLCVEEEDIRKILSEPTKSLLEEMRGALSGHNISDTEIVICGKEARSPIFKNSVISYFNDFEVTWYDYEEALCAVGACLAQAHCNNGIDGLLKYKIDPIYRKEHTD